MRSLVISYDLEDDFAIVAPVKRCNLESLNHLLNFLYQEWNNNKFQFSPKCYLAMQRAAALFPRLDINGCGFNTNWLENATLELLFVGEVKDDKLLPSRLMKLHEATTIITKKTVPKKPGESLTPADVPVPSSGLESADILATLISIDDSVTGAFELYRNLDAEQISAVISHLNELRKDPKERLNEYLNQQFEAWKNENKQTYHQAIFG